MSTIQNTFSFAFTFLLVVSALANGVPDQAHPASSEGGIPSFHPEALHAAAADEKKKTREWLEEINGKLTELSNAEDASME